MFGDREFHTPKNLAFTSMIQKRAVGFLENAKTQGAIAVEKDTVTQLHMESARTCPSPNTRFYTVAPHCYLWLFDSRF